MSVGERWSPWGILIRCVMSPAVHPYPGWKCTQLHLIKGILVLYTLENLLTRLLIPYKYQVNGDSSLFSFKHFKSQKSLKELKLVIFSSKSIKNSSFQFIVYSSRYVRLPQWGNKFSLMSFIYSFSYLDKS